MDKLQYDQKVDKLINEANRLVKQETIGYETAIFLDKEATKLEMIILNDNSSDEEKESASEKLEILYSRIKYEMSHSGDNDNETKRIENELKLLTEEGYTENE